MTPSTETDRYVLAQVQSALLPGETVVACAYLSPVVGGRGGGKAAAVGAFFDAASKMAAFAALTDQRRLLLVQTRIGAFKPLLENHGLLTFSPADLKGVALGGTLLLERADGALVEYEPNLSQKALSTQASFFPQLQAAFGQSAAAAAHATAKRTQSRAGLVIGLVIAAAYVWYRLS